MDEGLLLPPGYGLTLQGVWDILSFLGAVLIALVVLLVIVAKVARFWFARKENNVSQTHKSVVHIYAFALTWLLLFIFVADFVLADGSDVLILFAGSFVVSILVWFAIRGSRSSQTGSANKTVSQPAVSAPITTGNPEVDALIREGQELIHTLQVTSSQLENRVLAGKTGEIINISNDIIRKLIRQPNLLSSVKRFLNYYLPTTQKLVSNYSYMEEQSVRGKNIAYAMQKIEKTLDTMIDAYKNQLDALFSGTAMDVSTDIDVLESILKSEGLTQADFADKAAEADASTVAEDGGAK